MNLLRYWYCWTVTAHWTERVKCNVPLSFIQMAQTMARLVMEMVENPPHVTIE